MKQAGLPFRHELIVVNFAGGGGACKGIVNATGRHIDIAINHDAEAIAMHTANHPATKHYVKDVFAVKSFEVTKGQPVGLAWFSPDCKHFSKAKGGKPVEKKIRGLAWVVIKWARTVAPRVIMLENVEEFEDWGPLRKDNTPCPLRKGLTFRRWRKQLENCGYVVEMKLLRACDYGAPTIRKRLFIMARRDGRKIVWPMPTHGKGRRLLPYRTAAECIDWSIPCPSIFERERPLAEATMRRIAAGIKRYVIDCADPFIVPLTHQGADRGYPIDEPFRTVTGAHRGELALITPFMGAASGPAYAQKSRSAQDPINTLTADTRTGVVIPTLIQTGYGERPGQAPRVPGLEKPLGTAVDGQKHGLVAAFLAQHNSDRNGRAKPGRSATEPLSTLTAIPNHQQPILAFMEQANTDMVGHDARKPLSTIVGKGCTQRIITAQVVGCGGRAGQSPPRPMDEPTATQTSKADSCIAASHLMKLKGTCKDGQPLTEPVHTIQAEGTHFAEVRTFLEKYLPDAFGADRLGIVNVHGVDYVIVDIGMRMLQPRELFRAQGFPDSYVIDPIVNGKPLTKTAQVRMCGNSVCPPVAEALVRANFRHEQEV
jgi:DNA (cytosine-5)-methyltransferase 1